MWLTKGLKKNKRQEYIKVKKMHNIHRNVVSNQCIGTTSKECKKELYKAWRVYTTTDRKLTVDILQQSKGLLGDAEWLW